MGRAVTNESLQCALMLFIAGTFVGVLVLAVRVIRYFCPPLDFPKVAQTWQSNDAYLLGHSFTLRASRRSYIAWVAWILNFLLFSYIVAFTALAYESERWAQVTLSLVVGTIVLSFANLIAIRLRRITVTPSGYVLRQFFQKRQEVLWSDVERIEAAINAQWVTYRMRVRQQDFILGSHAWTNAHAFIGYALGATLLPIQRVGSISTKIRGFELLPLTVLAIAFSVLSKEAANRQAGLLALHIVWSVFLFLQPRESLSRINFYLAIFSIATLLTLAWLAGPDLPAALVWWLYAPLPELLFVPIVFWVLDTWRKTASYSEAINLWRNLTKPNRS